MAKDSKTYFQEWLAALRPMMRVVVCWKSEALPPMLARVLSVDEEQIVVRTQGSHVVEIPVRRDELFHDQLTVSPQLRPIEWYEGQKLVRDEWLGTVRAEQDIVVHVERGLVRLGKVFAVDAEAITVEVSVPNKKRPRTLRYDLKTGYEIFPGSQPWQRSASCRVDPVTADAIQEIRRDETLVRIKRQLRMKPLEALTGKQLAAIEQALLMKEEA